MMKRSMMPLPILFALLAGCAQSSAILKHRDLGVYREACETRP